MRLLMMLDEGTGRPGDRDGPVATESARGAHPQRARRTPRPAISRPRRQRPRIHRSPSSTGALKHGVATRYIQPGKPDQNAYIERFHRSYRTLAGGESGVGRAPKCSMRTSLNPSRSNAP